MKKFKYIAITIFTLILLVGCKNSEKNQKLGDVLKLKEESIKQIIVETTLTDKKSEVVLEKKDYKKFLNKISSYSIVEKNDNKKKGWQYLVKIESDKNIQFSIMDNIIYINDKIYVSNNLNKDDLLYLFENK